MLLVHEQAFWQRDTGLERVQLTVIERAAPLPHAVIVSGLPRVGKSTLLAQFTHRPGQDPFDYINFEVDRFLKFQADDANNLYAVLLELYGER
jgi:predicted AAA+ superfamily ATPase